MQCGNCGMNDFAQFTFHLCKIIYVASECTLNYSLHAIYCYTKT